MNSGEREYCRIHGKKHRIADPSREQLVAYVRQYHPGICAEGSTNHWIFAHSFEGASEAWDLKAEAWPVRNSTDWWIRIAST